MMYDIAVIAGTSEAREVIEAQLKQNKKILASVATPLGAEMLTDYPVKVHVGRLDLDGFCRLFTENPCGKIIDASHPFAKAVTDTVRQAAARLKIPYERYERRSPAYDYDKIYRVSDPEEAIRVLNAIRGNILLTTGVNTAAVYARGVREGSQRLYIRVLDTEASRTGCRQAGYPEDHVCAAMPPYSLEDNLALIRRTGAAVMVSKDSGKRGGVDVKAEACKQAGIPMVLISRPGEIAVPRVLIAGVGSGCGKTSITCGILRALVQRGIRVQSYKCGPDYIDPMLHTYITGRACRNLDPFFSEEEDLACLVAKDSCDAEFSVAEGVMGYYDGIGVTCEKSTHTVAVAAGIPTILVLNVKGMSHTIIPLLKGLTEYKKNFIKGVILNRCSGGLYDMIKPEIEKETGLRVVGYFPQQEGVHIASRHLGLMTAAEIENLDQVIDLLGETAGKTLDLDEILRIGREAGTLKAAQKEPPSGEKVRIAVARDKAFCFYYEENLDILAQLGAELVPFSPVRDRALPEGTRGIYLGGGYPEVYREALSANDSMRQSVIEATERGVPLIAECGGFMYAADRLVDTDGSTSPMLSLISTDVHMTKKLSREFGYVIMEARRDTPYFTKGTRIRVHEFHYSRADRRGDACVMRKQTGRQWQGLYVQGNILAGYPHLYFRNCRQIAENFVRLARGTQDMSEDKIR